MEEVESNAAPSLTTFGQELAVRTHTNYLSGLSPPIWGHSN